MLRRFPEVRSIHWAVNDTPAEVTNLPTVLLWGEDAIEEEILGLRFRVRPNAFLQTNTEMAETLYSIARDYAGLTGDETVYDLYCGTGHDRARARGPGADRLGRRDLRGVGRVRDRERRAERDHERRLLRRQRLARARGAARARRPARCRRRRSAARGARGQGAPPDGAAGGAADRLRLVQPDDARLGPEDAARGLRLRAAPLHPGRHVPAHAAHRERQPARARRAWGGRAVAARPPPDVSRSAPRGRARARRARSGRCSGAGTRIRSPGSAGRPATSHSVVSSNVSGQQADHRHPRPADPEPEPMRRPRETARRRGCRAGRGSRTRPRRESGTRSRCARTGPACSTRRSPSARARPTSASTQGMMSAIRTTQESASKTCMNT